MRSVSRATWTLVLPVSCSPAPNLAAISRLRSVVMVIAVAQASSPGARARSRKPVLRGDLSRALHVAAHLLDEILGRLEASLAAQPGQEVQPQLVSIEVPVEVEDLRLDQLTATRQERGAHADVHGRRHRRRKRWWAACTREGVRQARVHTVAWAHHRVTGDQVRCREAQFASAFVAVHDLAAQLELRAEEAARLIQL